MSRSFLAMLRGADARSIGHALAILFVFNTVFGAFHSGLMTAAVAGEVVLCSSEGAVRAPGQLPGPPAGEEVLSCCVLGNGPAPVALAAEPARLSAPTPVATVSPPLRPDRRIPDIRHSGSASPRGPPLLA